MNGEDVIVEWHAQAVAFEMGVHLAEQFDRQLVRSFLERAAPRSDARLNIQHFNECTVNASVYALVFPFFFEGGGG